MKRLLIILLTSTLLITVGCSSQYGNSSDDTPMPETSKEIQEQMLELSESDIKIINDNLIELTLNTSHQDSIFKIKMDEKDKTWINIAAIKPITYLMTQYDVTTSDDLVKKIQTSLIFDNAYDCILSETNKDFGGMKIYFYDNEENYNKNEFYTLKSISK